MGPYVKLSGLPDIPKSVTAFAQIRVPIELDPLLEKEPWTQPTDIQVHLALYPQPTRLHSLQKRFSLAPTLDYCNIWENPAKVRFVRFVSPGEPMSYEDPKVFVKLYNRRERERKLELQANILAAERSNREVYGVDIVRVVKVLLFTLIRAFEFVLTVPVDTGKKILVVQ
ncbi:hypothetical protein MSAN_01255100 [Mycena sanguinolenta]|uniref:Uncharacterized protein n=1 Tax=Mycena sanguinolenta TaxID=230812 RepID=A0A8H6YJM5_9AGAR|nr:hypothetical protein MSAN_01255100 [Mycena sanguinolenta]